MNFGMETHIDEAKSTFKMGHQATFVGIDSQLYVAVLNPIMVVV